MPKREDSYPDPDDLQFGKSASEKEEAVDAAIDRGSTEVPPDDDEEDAPRPGNKADPDA